jgi:hypothetical protein
MTNIRIFLGLWEFSENPSVKPVFKCLTGTLENGVYTQFPGKDEPWDTTVEELYQRLDSNDDIISLSKYEMERILAKDGRVYWYGSGHGAYMAVVI